jgi:hypothetical protein
MSDTAQAGYAQMTGAVTTPAVFTSFKGREWVRRAVARLDMDKPLECSPEDIAEYHNMKLSGHAFALIMFTVYRLLENNELVPASSPGRFKLPSQADKQAAVRRPSHPLYILEFTGNLQKKSTTFTGFSTTDFHR